MHCILTPNQAQQGGSSMTNEQRALVRTFRNAGLGYGAIARKTGISLNTVKSFCRRNEQQKTQEKGEQLGQEHLCRNCGVPVKQNTGRKEKKFCSDRCRNQWWNTHRDQINYRAVRTITCANCRRTISVYGNSIRRYCCHACYIQHRFGSGSDE